MEHTLDDQRKLDKNICPKTPTGSNVVHVSPEFICKDYKGFRIANYEEDKEALLRKASALTKKIDRISIILFSVAYIIFNGIYFNYWKWILENFELSAFHFVFRINHDFSLFFFVDQDYLCQYINAFSVIAAK